MMIMGLWNKYDVDGHYFPFAAQIQILIRLAGFHQIDIVTVATLPHTAVVFRMQSFNFKWVLYSFQVSTDHFNRNLS